jgi:myo-inositol-1(or 4)-monophosphatase
MITRDKLEFLKKGIISIVREVINPQSLSDSLQIERKSDFTIVTRIDKEVSEFVQREMNELIENSNFHFFSEENKVSFGFPSIILDPIDGTRELSKGLGECVVSMALMKSPREGFAWLFNPFTGFEIFTSEDIVSPVSFNEKRLFGYVSRTDFSKGILDHIKGSEDIFLEPRGSIAFKIGLLASGACDFVYSRTPKNIWDIAAGTLLCWQRGLKLYQDGIEVKELSSQRVDGELIWCREKDIKRLYDSLVKK